MVKERRLNKPSDIKNLMAEQINQLRNNAELDPVQKAKAIGYLANTSLSAYKEGEGMEKLEKIQKMLEERGY
ncbi:hypothetical protein [Planomicrobium sp. YIM 101495]|uniref:hypothetical protein n=1 Tax=Planomicrobium sp. YIM 101495 TaxID=2665160 RepID=UPI0012B9E320|nr:hypothetical protein [Planomicrobium sp. YIM 101495]MTD31843.1 hypothetical protein [Planomicrobium sp. YIM 101495]